MCCSAMQGGASLGELPNVTVTPRGRQPQPISIWAAQTPARSRTVEIVGSRIVRGVDVSSTESATNITREELVRLPVERDASSVALLSPGLIKGDGDLGGISFGGSSVAENTFYINGLNVTDFYNRIGFSEVPFCVLQGIPGQDRRLLGRVRPHARAVSSTP